MDPPHTPPPTTTPSGDVGGVGGGRKQSPTPKIRLMISYGGHILPRPHDKALFYAGGETRIISVPRTTALSLSSLFTHISKALFNNGSHNFLLKYQLPHLDLDSLISIASDEDLLNMIDEYDRLALTGRIRFFVFKRDDEPQPKTCGGGSDVGDDWFADALKVTGSNPIANNCGGGGGEDTVSPESIVLESSSSFGSTNSSNSPGNNKNGDDLKVVLPSVDSLESDTSIPSPNFSQQEIVYQDASGFVDSKVAVNLVETEGSASDHPPRSDILTPVQVSGYMISKPPVNQPQYPSPQPPLQPAHVIHQPNPGSQSNYVAQYYPGSLPVAYTPMYQTYVQPQQPFPYQLNKPYPVYMMPVGQTQNFYDASSIHRLTTPPTVSSSQPLMPINPVVAGSPLVYEGYKPTIPGPEYTAKVYGPTSVATQPVTLPPSVNQPSQPLSAPPVENTNYISDYEDPMHAQIYKTQPSGSTLPSQLQVLPESFSQLQMENAKH